MVVLSQTSAPSRSALMEKTGGSWSQLLRYWDPDSDPDRLGPPKQWKFLITIVNCGNVSEIRNPPRTVEELKDRMRETIGIETEESGMASEAIVTGLDGPTRRPIETDEDLQEFWESLSGDPLEGANWETGDMGTQTSTHESTKGGGGGGHGHRGGPPSHGGGGGGVKKPNKDFGGQRGNYGGSEEDAAYWQQELEDYKDKVAEEIEGYKRSIENLQRQNAKNEETIGQLQTDNLEFINQFEARLKEKEAILIRNLEGRFNDRIESQARQIVEGNARADRAENIVKLRDQHIKEQDSQLRATNQEVQKLETAVRNEKAQCVVQAKMLEKEKESKKEALQEAGKWKTKYEKTVEEDSQRDPGGFDMRILNFTYKSTYYSKGRMMQSKEFIVPGLSHPIQFEFFPNGDLNAQDGWCSLKLRVPDCTTLRWSAYIGRLKKGPRTDHFEQKQWWNKYGLVMLNFCSVAEMKRMISSETDSLVVGVEIHGSGPMTVSPPPSRPCSAALLRDDGDMGGIAELFRGGHRPGRMQQHWGSKGGDQRPGTAPAGLPGHSRSQPGLGFGLRGENRPRSPSPGFLNPLKEKSRAPNTSTSSWPKGAMSPDPRRKQRGFG